MQDATFSIPPTGNLKFESGTTVTHSGQTHTGKRKVHHCGCEARLAWCYTVPASRPGQTRAALLVGGVESPKREGVRRTCLPGRLQGSDCTATGSAVSASSASSDSDGRATRLEKARFIRAMAVSCSTSEHAVIQDLTTGSVTHQCAAARQPKVRSICRAGVSNATGEQQTRTPRRVTVGVTAGASQRRGGAARTP